MWIMTKLEIQEKLKEYGNFTFGKYKDCLISDVFTTDISYLAWCIENVKSFKLETDLKDDIMYYYRVCVDNIKNRGKRNMMKKYGMHVTEVDNFYDYEQYY